MSNFKLNPIRILLFEPEYAGHQMEFLMLFVKRVIQEKNIDLSLVITAELLKRLRVCIEWKELEIQHKVKYVLLTKLEKKRCNHSLLALRSFWLWYTLRTCLKRTPVNFVVSMRVDHFQLALAFRLPLASSLIGILFQPSLHYVELEMTSTPCTMRERIKNIRQRVLYSAMLNNPVMHTLFTLDDTFAGWGATQLSGGEKIGYIPDPSHPELSHYKNTMIANHLPKGRTIFLLFGALARRKGVFSLLAALRLLSVSERQNICVVFAGKINESERKSFQQQVTDLQVEDVDSCLHIDGFLPTEDLITLLRQCDVVLACYQHFVGSSGILLWAASAGKPVLAQSYGLVGRWVVDKQLGMSVNTSNPAEFSHALIALSDENIRRNCFNKGGLDAFSLEHHPDFFAKQIVSTIIEAPSL
ncbi:MAG: glycosyltransferase [Mariprofundaceae bacterium]|nr:glycosyltransferase [Mariprofundaceae bacterium]